MVQRLEKCGINAEGRPVVFCVMDGVGVFKEGPGNAFWLAKPENILKFIEEAKQNKLYREIYAHGEYVGLTDGDMGNSEVGHNALGSGNIYTQGARLVIESMREGTFWNTQQWKDMVVDTIKAGKTVHLFGLLSSGNVHSHIDQQIMIIQKVVECGGKRIRFHPLLDGRDVAPDSGLEFIAQLEEALAKARDAGCDACIASGGGRMHLVMDRYNAEWSMVERGFNQIVHGVVDPADIKDGYKGYYTTAKEAIEEGRRLFPTLLDQYAPGFVIVDAEGKPVGKLEEGDVVINTNFRGDRALEISNTFDQGAEFDKFDRAAHGPFPAVKYAGMLQYDSDLGIPKTYLVPPPSISDVMSEYTCELGIKSFAIAETHKYGHVTFFWNGNRLGYINKALEKYVEIPSEPSDMIEANPAMKAKEVTDELVAAIEAGEFDYYRVNYANGDMVGHTGSVPAAVEAVKTVDESLGRLWEAVKAKGGILVVTADHGNCEEVLDGKGKPKTSHTTNPVPFWIMDAKYDGKYTVNQDIDGGLANCAATTMNLLGYEKPEGYMQSLIDY
ncbi:2,3-bisphosphoglycerate-independent phosphoglycerate mutase [Carpediemonas membranifera]|uniref:phosphoglycerate mutase (2,3-diphosphoglycerate-independent) n=1 Tax=Carpediemonas membranifera TaxID=201153 RepID=A0A8J6E2D5_9EUKA|nr:2,3-bisphosphoglycerate-independent phosphoglycerate mutase [Carpediemonas membranifera]|eukprot:KAG9394196.1 2,3-bisphosphoglycerate-independent phosphoglycerate mutase [Carpediemonas membranifera]